MHFVAFHILKKTLNFLVMNEKGLESVVLPSAQCMLILWIWVDLLKSSLIDSYRIFHFSQKIIVEILKALFMFGFSAIVCKKQIYCKN